jgi:hypothetical protein
VLKELGDSLKANRVPATEGHIRTDLRMLRGIIGG